MSGLLLTPSKFMLSLFRMDYSPGPTLVNVVYATVRILDKFTLSFGKALTYHTASNIWLFFNFIFKKKSHSSSHLFVQKSIKAKFFSNAKY